MDLTSEQTTKIERFKKQWQRASELGDKEGMAQAKEAADKVRGFVTDSSGTNKIGELPTQSKPTYSNPAIASTSTIGSTTGMSANDISAAKRRLATEAIKNAMSSKLTALESEKAQIPKIGAAERAGLAGASAARARSMGEYIANRGLQSAGSTAQAELLRQGQLGSQTAASFGKEASQLADVANRQTAIRQEGASSLANLEMQLLGEDEARINRIQDIARDEAYKNAVLTGRTATGELTIAGQQAEQSKIDALVKSNYGDLKQAMNDYVAKGGSQNDPAYRALASARNIKLEDMRKQSILEEREKAEFDLNKLYKEAQIADSRTSTAYNQARLTELQKEVKNNPTVQQIVKEARDLHKLYMSNDNPISIERAIDEIVKGYNILLDDEDKIVLKKEIIDKISEETTPDANDVKNDVYNSLNLPSNLFK